MQRVVKEYLFMGWVGASVVMCVFSIYNIQSSIPSTGKKGGVEKQIPIVCKKFET